MYKRSYNLPGALAMAVISAIEQVGTPLTVANKVRRYCIIARFWCNLTGAFAQAVIITIERVGTRSDHRE